MREELLKHKQAFIFELDNVLYPEKDYLLQVYYLFAHLLEYMETVPPAPDLLDFLKKAYEYHGTTGLFERASQAFSIDQKYGEAYQRLHVQAKLPLKLILYQELLPLLEEILRAGKSIFILTRGNPLMQLNKVRQIEWGEMSQYIRTYFYDELYAQGHTDPLSFLLQENQLKGEEVLLIGAEETGGYSTPQGVIDYLPIRQWIS